MLDSYKTTIKHLLSICLLDETCMRIFLRENFNPEIFQEYKELYVEIKKNVDDNGTFNIEVFSVTHKNNENITNLLWNILETRSNVNTFDKLLKLFKHEAFKNELASNIETANLLLSTNKPEDTKKAYFLLHKEIELAEAEKEVSTDLNSMVESYSLDDKRVFLNLGFHALDFVKVDKNDLVVIGARPSIGKSAFLFNLIRGMKIKSTLISLEMGKEAVFDRFLAMYSNGVPMSAIREKKFTEAQKLKVNEGLEKVKKIPCNIIDDCGFDLQSIVQIIRKEVKKGSKAIFIDYLQLMKIAGYKQNRNQEVGDITKELKGLCKELKIPIFILAQVSRGLEQRADKRPSMSDLRDSGEIEQDVDIAMFLYRDSYYYDNKKDDTTFEVIVGKNRQGECKTAYLDYLRHFQIIQSRER